jgi:hypothetical protein
MADAYPFYAHFTRAPTGSAGLTPRYAGYDESMSDPVTSKPAQEASERRVDPSDPPEIVLARGRRAETPSLLVGATALIVWSTAALVAGAVLLVWWLG